MDSDGSKVPCVRSPWKRAVLRGERASPGHTQTCPVIHVLKLINQGQHWLGVDLVGPIGRPLMQSNVTLNFPPWKITRLLCGLSSEFLPVVLIIIIVNTVIMIWNVEIHITKSLDVLNFCLQCSFTDWSKYRLWYVFCVRKCLNCPSNSWRYTVMMYMYLILWLDLYCILHTLCCLHVGYCEWVRLIFSMCSACVWGLCT